MVYIEDIRQMLHIRQELFLNMMYLALYRIGWHNLMRLIVVIACHFYETRALAAVSQRMVSSFYVCYMLYVKTVRCKFQVHHSVSKATEQWTCLFTGLWLAP
jgi:hypothetical protein